MWFVQIKILKISNSIYYISIPTLEINILVKTSTIIFLGKLKGRLTLCPCRFPPQVGIPLKGSEVESSLSHNIFLSVSIPDTLFVYTFFVREEDIRPEGAISSHVSPIPSRTSALLKSSTQFSASWVLLSMYHSTRVPLGHSYKSTPDIRLTGSKGSNVVLNPTDWVAWAIYLCVLQKSES